MTIDFTRCRLSPFAHQREDVAALIKHPYFFITSEMRTGKSKIVVDAAQFLFEANIIDKVLVVAPAPVRDVWYDPVFGEISKHLWEGIFATVTEFHVRPRSWKHPPSSEKSMIWCVSNYEFLRSKNRLAQLLPFCTYRTLLVGDESSFLKNYAARQTKAFLQLRRACGRVVLLNGTPISHSPLDLFSQGNILHPSILDCKYITYYKARYAIQSPVLGYGGKPITTPRGIAIQEVTGWTNLDDLQRRFAPYTVRRLQKDCLDLPPKLDPVTLTAELTPETWRTYRDMRDELMVWLKDGTVTTAAQAAVKVLRLSQITSGFVGGVEAANIDDMAFLESLDTYGLGAEKYSGYTHVPAVTSGTQEIGREKLDVVLWFLKQRLEQDPFLKVVIWCRFRPELFRLVFALTEHFPQVEVASIHGGQKKAERLYALQLLHPDTASKDKAVFVVGTLGTGSFGINLSAASVCINCSSDYSLGKHLQANDRIYGPGMLQAAAYYNVLAVGPKGQRTIDHVVEAARRGAEDIATWTASAWLKALSLVFA